MATVLLGNSQARDGGESLPGLRVTTVHLPDRLSVEEVLRSLFDANGLWPVHSDSQFPDWVECSDEAIADAISVRADCPIGRPADWEG
jgi:hypothetical protein